MSPAAAAGRPGLGPGPARDRIRREEAEAAGRDPAAEALADALLYLDEGRLWIQGAARREANGEVYACSVGALDVATEAERLRDPWGRRPLAMREAMRRLALAMAPGARCFPEEHCFEWAKGKGHVCEADGKACPEPDVAPELQPCGDCAAEVVATGNDEALGWAEVGKAFAAAIVAGPDARAAVGGRGS